MTVHTTPESSPVKARVLQSAVLNSAGFASIGMDEKGIIQLFNPGAERMLGYTEAEVVNKLNSSVKTVLQLPDVVERLTGFGMELAPGSPQDLGRLIKDEIAKWKEVARIANIRAD